MHGSPFLFEGIYQCISLEAHKKEAYNLWPPQLGILENHKNQSGVVRTRKTLHLGENMKAAARDEGKM